MALIPSVVSVHQLVSSVGADVGFASLIGLALLVLLFFSQARETATLRTRADEAGERIQELEAELADLADQLASLPAEISVRAASPRAAAAFGAAQSGARVTAAAGGAALPPAAPAGVGAPALAAATRLIPDPVHPLPEYAPAGSPGNGNGTSARPVVAASAATVQRPVQAPPSGTGRPASAPPRVGTGGGGGDGRPGRGPGAVQGRPPGAGQPRPGMPHPGAPVRQPARRSWGRMVLGALIALVALGAIAVGVIVLSSGGKTASTAHKSPTNATLASHRSTAVTPVQPATVTVSVLNGTDMQGLALTVFNKLLADGYRKGSTPANAADQTHTSTIVAYMTSADRRDAVAVANSLKLGAGAVQPVDPTTKATVCPPSQACTTRVVVTVGKDLSHQ